MLSELNNSKETIKNRMLKHALNYWDTKNTDDLDPAVKLILEALSTELYNLGNEIKNTQLRILEKIAGLLAPDFLTAPNPAHALMYASPVEPAEELKNTAHFFTQRKISSKPNEVPDTALDVFFTPVDSVRVFDAQLTHIASGGFLFAYDQNFNKQLLARSRGNLSESNILWLGLKLNPGIEHIQNLSFCFDWKNLDPKSAMPIYKLLPLAKWYVGNKTIETSEGIEYLADTNENNSGKNFFPEYNMISLMENDIKNIYNGKFISIKDSSIKNSTDLKQNYPPSFKTAFAENDLQKLNDKLLWIKIVFPAAMKQEHLDEAYVYLNTFPVMNRRLNDLKYRLKGGGSIIPLKTDLLDQFLSVKNLTDDNRVYKSVPYRKMEEEETGTYTLRNGGVERFDGRSARELISYLVELLRSESAAFSTYGYDFIATTLREMDQKISLMEQKTKANITNAAEMPNYIIVKPFEGQDVMYAEYWTTLAETANNLRAGTKMQLAKGVKLKQDSVVLITTTTGGKNRLRPGERLNALRYSIMTRNRIITADDIRNFCFYELGNSIKKVEVKRGFEMSPNNKEAFRRTIDVMITPSETGKLQKQEWEQLCEQLKIKLQVRSGMSNNYRVMLSNEQ